MEAADQVQDCVQTLESDLTERADPVVPAAGVPAIEFAFSVAVGYAYSSAVGYTVEETIPRPTGPGLSNCGYWTFVPYIKECVEVEIARV